MSKDNLRRLLPLCMIAVLLFASVVQAQDGASRTLEPGVAVTATLDTENILQVYLFEGLAEQEVTLTASNALGVPLAIVLSDASGQIVAQIVDEDVTGDVALEAVSLPADGTYYVTVFKAAGVASVSTLSFNLELAAAEAAAPTIEPTAEVTEVTAEPAETAVAPIGSAGFTLPGQVLTTSGLQVSLTWDSIADFDLEVRDPVGGSLYWETPTVDSGGTLSPNVNQGCVQPTAESPMETANWTSGGIPTGSYEVLVYYQGACAGEVPASFTISTVVDGTPLDPIEATLTPGEVFVSSFAVTADGEGVLNEARGIASEQVLPAEPAEILTNAQPIDLNTSISGAITNERPYQSFTFSAGPDDQLSISVQALNGSLDTYLALLDAGGAVIRFNDDAEIGVTNSAMNQILLPAEGTYTVVVTRYAKRIGGTEGEYTLTVASQPADIAQAFFDLPSGSLEARLIWNTNADLQLLVRDSAGDAIFDDIPQVRSGGRLAAAGNVNCTQSEGSPFSYIYWPTDITPRPGSYEVEVWYQNECNDTTPVSFNLYLSYNGQVFFSDTAQPIQGERYLTSFTIQANGAVEPSEAGIIRGIQTLDYQSELENASRVGFGETANGSITPTNKFDLFVFDARAGDVINVGMNATSGTLDTALYLIGPSGAQVAENDDAEPGENTNSLIADLTLPEDGQYIIIATHFGALYGGTTGTYTLTLSQLN